MNGKIKVGNTSQIDPLGARTVRAGGIEIALFKMSGGQIAAVENRCPHKNGKLAEGMVCERFVYCPLHEWKIDLISGEVQAPDEGNVGIFPVEVHAETGDIYIGPPSENQAAS